VFHTGRFAKALRVALTAALLLQCAVLSTAAVERTCRDAEPLVAATIPAAAVPSALRITERHRAGTDFAPSQPGAALVDAFRRPPAMPASGILRPPTPPVPSSAALPRGSGRSPPAASV
jgi:hypothetical protein